MLDSSNVNKTFFHLTPLHGRVNEFFPIEERWHRKVNRCVFMYPEGTELVFGLDYIELLCGIYLQQLIRFLEDYFQQLIRVNKPLNTIPTCLIYHQSYTLLVNITNHLPVNQHKQLLGDKN